ncbi:MAG: hypothetical protein IJX66_10280 [Lachnospiraceae bacterium]|nr:hypothetical protein [Lachnospiraceae bacterium]
MVTTNSITSAAGYYENTVQQKKDGTVKTKNNKISEPAVKSGEDKLSGKAKSYLDNLRKTYGDYDFIVADAGDDRRALLDKSNKEFSVIFSSSELERMATDEKYASEKMRHVETIVDMSNRICEQFGYERTWGKGGGNDTIINKLAVSINDDGSMSIFAELEKMSDKQKDYIEKLQEKRAEEKKTAEKSEEKKVNSYKKDDTSSVKKVVVEASSEEELVEKIKNVDWNKVSGEKVGARFDFSV